MPAEARHIGRDRDGYDHYLVPGDRVLVVEHAATGDRFVRKQSLVEHEVSTWIDYVANRRGWTCCKYDDRPFAEWLLQPRVPQAAGR